MNAIDEFHKLYYGTGPERIWHKTNWLGFQTLKCPLDMWIYQEIICDIKPDYVIECGTWNGGSALFLATICDLIKKGTIITIDFPPALSALKLSNAVSNDPNLPLPSHSRIKYITGSSIEMETINQVRNLISSSTDKIMVILDSDHKKDHVLKEMELYSLLVSKDSYLIVEDTNLNGHPVVPEHGEGPMEAINEFLKTHDEFIIDKEKEKFLMTFNPNGYLKRIK